MSKEIKIRDAAKVEFDRLGEEIGRLHTQRSILLFTHMPKEAIALEISAVGNNMVLARLLRRLAAAPQSSEQRREIAEHLTAHINVLSMENLEELQATAQAKGVEIAARPQHDFHLA